MRKEPANRLSRKGLTVWRLYGWLQTAVVLLLAIGAGTLTFLFDWPSWIYIIAASAVALYGWLFIYLFPKIRWSRWRYEVRETEIELQHGIFIVTRTLIPMVRVQHVDTSQGPILKKYDLSAISISSAATVHSIPAIATEEADELRNRISALAKVAEDDV
ncbi:PH domain-containing protein [Sporosarcina gallistercoris]|uniref:PH domain-containing protein n=1 Tax=Sporosarcina gallistercoris TaxID=2762245 RepID=UPI003D2AD4A3